MTEGRARDQRVKPAPRECPNFQLAMKSYSSRKRFLQCRRKRESGTRRASSRNTMPPRHELRKPHHRSESGMSVRPSNRRHSEGSHEVRPDCPRRRARREVVKLQGKIPTFQACRHFTQVQTHGFEPEPPESTALCQPNLIRPRDLQPHKNRL
jgi:hypothetical protein